MQKKRVLGKLGHGDDEVKWANAKLYYVEYIDNAIRLGTKDIEFLLLDEVEEDLYYNIEESVWFEVLR
jgi:hypothetical protein